jgi:peptidoglycan/xylan/chitin deacetylase (PgdA/CDA1 family)
VTFLDDYNNISRFKRKIKLVVNLIKPFTLSPHAAVIFLFHTVEEESTPWTHRHRYVTPFPIFKKQIAFIRKHFEIMSTSALLQKINNNDLNSNLAAIHFDDGFSSYENVSLPFLKEQNIPSTVFLINSVLNGDVPIRNKIAFCINMGEKKRLGETIQEYIKKKDDKAVDLIEMCFYQFLSWMKDNITSEMEYFINEIYNSCRKRHREKSPFMDMEAVQKLKENPYVEIGSHTINHPMLSQLDECEQRKEVIEGHKQLEEILGYKIKYFAYPHGGQAHFNETSRRIIRESKRLVSFSSYGGLNYDLDRTDVKRITLSDHTPLNIKLSVLKNAI